MKKICILLVISIVALNLSGCGAIAMIAGIGGVAGLAVGMGSGIVIGEHIEKKKLMRKAQKQNIYQHSLKSA